MIRFILNKATILKIKKVVNVRRRKRTEFEKEQLRYFDVIDFKEDNING